MKIYNIIGYFIITLYGLACVFFAPETIGPWGALAIGAVYIIVFWFLAGVYLADILHLGIAHRSLNFKPWFIKSVTIANNVFGVYVSPIEWVNCHRLHHKYSDHDGDPNKLGEDGFWKTLYLCLFPYPSTENLAKDDILKSRAFRLCSSNCVLRGIANLQFYIAVVHCRRREIRGRLVDRTQGLCAMGQHGAELLDPYARIRLPALS